ncbi:Uncharacterised protein [Mycobacteroides abscessus subsp. abscessus]|nr:Uncharacterised protein [Mycobacteroides abscessus subsp. abscessus]
MPPPPLTVSHAVTRKVSGAGVVVCGSAVVVATGDTSSPSWRVWPAQPDAVSAVSASTPMFRIPPCPRIAPR